MRRACVCVCVSRELQRASVHGVRAWAAHAACGTGGGRACRSACGNRRRKRGSGARTRAHFKFKVSDCSRKMRSVRASLHAQPAEDERDAETLGKLVLGRARWDQIPGWGRFL